MNRPRVHTLILITGIVMLSVSCSGIEIDEELSPTDSYERYVGALGSLGLSDRFLGRSWIDAGVAALRYPVIVSPPYRESGTFSSDVPVALGYSIVARRGQRVRVEFAFASRDPDTWRPYFVDLFSSESGAFRHLATLPPGKTILEFEPNRDGEFVVRIQPELLVDGAFSVGIKIEPSLVFPVSGATFADVGSFFGDSRDGGTREHQGVDIFAPRGTYVLAPGPGVVRRVGTNNLGGNIVLVFDAERNLQYYFAHLDTQLVQRGQQVRTGDILGTVGNSGNARTTPPHLHFGIYSRSWGSVDPYYFLVSAT